MTPEDIRRLFRAVEPASAAEAEATTQEALTDPQAARTLLASLYSLSVEDREIAQLLNLFIEGTIMRHIQERAEADDAEALKCAKLIVGLMRGLRRPARGRPRRPGTA